MLKTKNIESFNIPVSNENILTENTFDDFMNNCIKYCLQDKNRINIGERLENLYSDDVEIAGNSLKSLFLHERGSKLFWYTIFNYIYNLFSEEEGRTFAQVKTINVKKLPIKEISKIEQEPFIAKANKMLELNKKLQETKQNFTNELKLEKLPIKLQKFEELDFDNFVKEYVKAKKIKLSDQLEERNFKNNWLAIFENDKKEVLELQNQIKIIDKEIDRMVYKLYDLNEDEIKIVEKI